MTSHYVFRDTGAIGHRLVEYNAESMWAISYVSDLVEAHIHSFVVGTEGYKFWHTF